MGTLARHGRRRSAARARSRECRGRRRSELAGQHPGAVDTAGDVQPVGGCARAGPDLGAVYAITRFVQGTRAAGAKGLLVLLVLLTVVGHHVGGGHVPSAAISVRPSAGGGGGGLIVIFAPELRRAAIRIGETPFFRSTPGRSRAGRRGGRGVQVPVQGPLRAIMVFDQIGLRPTEGRDKAERRPLLPAASDHLLSGLGAARPGGGGAGGPHRGGVGAAPARRSGGDARSQARVAAPRGGGDLARVRCGGGRGERGVRIGADRRARPALGPADDRGASSAALQAARGAGGQATSGGARPARERSGRFDGGRSGCGWLGRVGTAGRRAGGAVGRAEVRDAQGSSDDRDRRRRWRSGLSPRPRASVSSPQTVVAIESAGSEGYIARPDPGALWTGRVTVTAEGSAGAIDRLKQAMQSGSRWPRAGLRLEAGSYAVLLRETLGLESIRDAGRRSRPWIRRRSSSRSPSRIRRGCPSSLMHGA